MEIKMFLLTAARVERSRVGRKALKHQLTALKHLPKAPKLQPKALKRLLGRLTSAFPTR